jgi:serine/threonine protein phosphatase PrpC
MNASAAFTIGRAHDVCQDYALARASSDMAVAIVADGCSSSPDTDIGARLLARAAARSIASIDSPTDESLERFHRTIVRQALAHARLLGVDPRAVDSTLLTVMVRDRRFFATCYGDGAIALKRRSGEIVVHSVAYAESFPRYPSYLADAGRMAALAERAENVKVVTETHFAPDGAVVSRASSSNDRASEVVTADVGEFDFVVALSDGIHSFVESAASETTRRSEHVSFEKVLPALLAFKSPAGAFARRRVSRFSVECGRRGWHHRDDLAVAAVYLGT